MKKEWTIMVYMAGDNNLSDDMISGIKAIEDGLNHTLRPVSPSSLPDMNGVAFLVEYDGEHPTVPSYRYDLTFEPGTYSTMGVKEPIDLKADKETVEKRIKEFIKWAAIKRPADNYALILSGHSDAFQGRTLLMDEHPPGVAVIQKISTAIEEAIKESPNIPKEKEGKLDLLGFDGCVMNTLEVMYEFRGVATTWIGSQGSIPNYTWNYFGLSRRIAGINISDLTVDKLVETIVDETRIYNKTYAFGGRSVDISACRLNQIEDIIDPLFKFGFLLISPTFINSPWVSSYFSKILFKARWACQGYMKEQSVDLWDYAECLAQECIDAEAEITKIPLDPAGLSLEAQAFTEFLEQLKDSIAELKLAIKNFVIRGAFAGQDYRFSKGVSVYMPWSFLGYSLAQENYTKLSFTKRTVGGILWWLFILLQVYSSIRPKVVSTVINLPPILSSFAPSLLKATKFNASTIDTTVLQTQVEGLIVKIMSDNNGSTRDNPHKTRGLDSYVDYFGKIRNLKIDLDVDGEYRF